MTAASRWFLVENGKENSRHAGNSSFYNKHHFNKPLSDPRLRRDHRTSQAKGDPMKMQRAIQKHYLCEHKNFKENDDVTNGNHLIKDKLPEVKTKDDQEHISSTGTLKFKISPNKQPEKSVNLEAQQIAGNEFLLGIKI